MADDPALVELLKFYKEKATVTRPEVGILTGKSVGTIAGVCHRNGIVPWPKDIPPEVIRDRPCQFPILRNGERYVCGLLRSLGEDSDPLCCSDHSGLTWNPKKENPTKDM